jgi:Ca2+-binding RTX toxin-like protein
METISGTPGPDTLLGYQVDGNSAELIVGSGDNDWINGRDGNDDLLGNAGNDYLFGANGHDTLRGGQGSDTLSGGNGRDELRGEVGADLLTGGRGIDTFVFNVAQANHYGDLVTDLNAFGFDDLIQLDNVGNGTVSVTEDGGAAYLHYNGVLVVTFAGATAQQVNDAII